ncbi:hypothetical protein ACFL7M_15115, partial [Thermodesulfobacteriota bacterium]
SFIEGAEIILGTRGGFQVDSRTMETQVSGIFAGGDFIKRPGSVVEAITAGKQAALAIHLKTLRKTDVDMEKKSLLGGGPSFSIHAQFHTRDGWDPGTVVRFEDIESLFLDQKPPATLPRLDPVERLKSFLEIDLSISSDEAEQEAGRCFFCGICTECDRCYIYCPEVSILPPEGQHSPYRIDSDHCKGCAICESVCIRGVMRMGEDK